MLKIQDLTPLNLQEEKEKFFKDSSYNPQFKYKKEIKKEELLKYGLPKQEYINIAKKILTRANFENIGEYVSQPEVIQTIEKFLKSHHLKNELKIVFSKKFLSRTSIIGNKIKIRLPISYDQEGLESIIHHELGTHFLRTINGRKNKIKKSKNYLLTEEGLAILNTLIEKKDKLAIYPALGYILCYKSQRMSFSQIYSYTLTYIKDKNKCWNMVLKQKRGLRDTSKPGGFTKSVVYLEGFIQVVQYLLNKPKDIKRLYSGKISLAEINKIDDIDLSKIIIPNFISNQLEQQLNIIAKENYLI